MRFSLCILTTCLSLHALPAHSLSSDREQPATIEADEVEFDFRTGKRTYKGNVIVVQGTLRITGEKIVVQYSNENEQVETATSWGNPATFRQRPDGKEGDVYGEGDTIVLNEIVNTLTLIKNASMTQAGNTAIGSKIVYDMATDRMTVKGLRQQQGSGDEVTTDSETGRAKVIIRPEKSSESGSATENSDSLSE
ncbi:MAG: Lipopolysaccharide export system protein LptA [Gammaproteobacteria bacterium]|nr:Lipopolysaccharide export system protein LptA [Gammaproteobacteria bacterium]